MMTPLGRQPIARQHELLGTQRIYLCAASAHEMEGEMTARGWRRAAWLPLWVCTSSAIGDVSVRVATYNIKQFDGDQPQFDAAVDVLLRVGADVVAVQEIVDETALASLAAAAGYDHVATASMAEAIDFTLRVGLLSRYPIVSAVTETSISLSGDPNAHDLTRNFLVATVDVPGAADDLVMITNHWKASTGDDNEFRRSLESMRAMQIVEGWDGTATPFIILGDMNDDLQDAPDSPTEFFSVPSGVPDSFVLGNDIFFPVANGVFLPLDGATGLLNLTVANPLQLDGTDATIVGGGRLDYLWLSDAVTLTASEVYDSADEGLPGGLPKDGSPPPSTSSADASDHLLVFADVAVAEPLILGACCLPDLTCTDGLTQTDCDTLGGSYQGDGSACDTSCASPPPPAVTINEIRIDQPSTDNDEYLELAGASGASLDGLTYLVIGDASAGSGVVESVVDLTGLNLPSDGLLLIAESTFTLNGAVPDAVRTLDFENSDNVTHLLVEGFSGALDQDLDTNDDGLLDVQPWSAVIDLIALIEEPNPPLSTEYHYGPPSIGPDGSFVPGHGFRCPDGDGTWQIGPFDPIGGLDTPGAPNSCPATPTGACCLMGACQDALTSSDCQSAGGSYLGDQSTCGVDSCPQPPIPCEGDANGDGIVDPFDGGYTLARFGCLVGNGDAECDAADVNADGLVDPFDYGFVLARFGECPSMAY